MDDEEETYTYTPPSELEDPSSSIPTVEDEADEIARSEEIRKEVATLNNQIRDAMQQLTAIYENPRTADNRITDVRTAERKTMYQKQGQFRALLWRRYLTWFYNAIFICFVGLLLVYQSNYSWPKKIGLVVLLYILPYLSYYVLLAVTIVGRWIGVVWPKNQHWTVATYHSSMAAEDM